MITAVFQHHVGFVLIALAVTLAIGAIVYWATARRIPRLQALFYGLWASAAAGPTALTTWNGSGILTFQCTVNPSITAALTSTQGQLNAVLFLPFGLLGVLATRRPAFAAATSVLFITSVETAQATMPFISRLCDTDDLVANAVGSLIGVAVGTFIRFRIRSGVSLTRATLRRATITGVVLSVAIVATWVVVITPVRAVQPTEDPTAGADQVEAINTALGKAFDGAYSVDEARLQNMMDGPDVVSASLPGGYAELTWPDREKLTVHFTPTHHDKGVHAYQIPGISKPVKNAQQAQDVATEYARTHASWALEGSEVKAWPVDKKDMSLGWMVEWRRWRGDLLMPMRLDILIEPSGRMSDLIARDVDDPRLPEARVSEEQAWQKLESHYQLEPDQAERGNAIYLVQRRDGAWRIHWSLAVIDGGTYRAAVVDATTGKIYNESSRPAESSTQPAAH